MSETIDWQRKDLWRVRQWTFTVEIVRSTEELSQHRGSPLRDEGSNRWFVYAYIYPAHPLFAQFSGDSIFQDALEGMPGHTGIMGCASLVRYHRNEIDITSVQVGFDYHHDGDRRFTFMTTKDEAHEVFADAERLIRWLTEYPAP